MLQFITKGNVNIKDQPRVFYTAHPRDHARYFEAVRSDVYRTQDCVFFYLEPDRQPDEHYYADLTEMQLFIIPVTGHFLLERSQAYEDFLFAQEHHIPVLLLMQEKGYETLFAEKCGDLQYLSKLEDHLDGIPYAEKLDRFLASVLVGKEMITRIRAAFDAYIFLSYRKKDRKQARWIMSQIHKYPDCRNFAIWYDEYLTPGEHFNETISQALQKSKIFVLVVTPNLLENGNYVMKNEYPMAKRLGKCIFPIESTATNYTSLRQKYPNLPALVSAKNSFHLKKLFTKQVRQISSPAGTCSADRQFLIGLAYLMGVDMEVDREVGTSLIRQAANEDLPEAICTLADLFQYGIGVPRDISLAAKYRIPLHQRLYAKLRADVQAEDMALFLRNAGALFDLCFCDVPRYTDTARECIQNVLEILQSANKHCGNTFAVQEAHWLSLVGSDLVFGDALGFSSDERLASLKKAIAIYRMLHCNDHNEKLADCLLSLGTKLYLYDMYNEAIQVTEDAIVCWKNLVRKDEMPHLPQMARCYMNLHVCCVATGDDVQAESAAKQSVKLLEGFSAKYGAYAIQNELTDAYDYLATFYEQSGHPEKAAALYQKAIDRYSANTVSVAPEFLQRLREDLAKYYRPKSQETQIPKVMPSIIVGNDTNARMDAEQQAFNLLNRGNNARQDGFLDLAEQYYLQGIQIMRQITPHSLGYRVMGAMMFTLAETHIDLCDGLLEIYTESGRYEEAISYAQEALDLQNAIVRADSSQQDGLSTRYLQLAHIYRQSGNLQLSLTYYNMILAGELAENDYCSIVSTYASIADIHIDRGSMAEAESVLNLALQLIPRLQMEYLFHVIPVRNLYCVLTKLHQTYGNGSQAQHYAKLDEELTQKIKNWL